MPADIRTDPGVLDFLGCTADELAAMTLGQFVDRCIDRGVCPVVSGFGPSEDPHLGIRWKPVISGSTEST